MEKHRRLVLALVFSVVFLGVGAIGVSATGVQSDTKGHPASVLSSARSHIFDLASSLGIGEDESEVAPGTIDDGKELLPQAKVTLDQAIDAATGAYSGDIGEVDLEHYKGQLVFNIDVGAKDVKVDAVSGTVLGAESDD